MKVLVQRAKTQEYLCGDGTWNNDPRFARVFETAVQGAEFCREMEEVLLIVKFSDNRPTLILPGGKPVVTVNVGARQNEAASKPPLNRP